MKKLGTYTDITINEQYDLYQTTLFELRDIMTKRYKDAGIKNIRDFDNENRGGEYDHHNVPSSNVGANMYLHNNFFVTQGIGTKDTLLLDGYNRLFVLDKADDQGVFVKDYSLKLKDRQVIWMLYQLNYWKKARDRSINHMYDRGFALYTFMKIGINLADKEYRSTSLFTLAHRYTSANIWQDYDSYVPDRDKQNGKIMFENDKFFDDLKLIIQLHETKVTVPSRGHEQETPVSFYAIVATLRTLQLEGKIGDWNIDVEHLRNFLATDPEAIKLTHVFFTKQLSNGRSAARKAVTDYVMNKYIKPVVLNAEAGTTEAERKKELKKKIAKRDRMFESIKEGFVVGETYYMLGNNGKEPTESAYVYIGAKVIDSKSLIDGSIEKKDSLVFKDEKGNERGYNPKYLRHGTFHVKRKMVGKK